MWVEAMLLDGAVTDVNVAKALVEDYMEEHKDHLPQYAK